MTLVLATKVKTLHIRVAAVIDEARLVAVEKAIETEWEKLVVVR